MVKETLCVYEPEERYMRLRYSRELIYFYGGEEKCRPGHSWGPGIRRYILMHYVISGSGVFIYDGRTYRLSAGDCFFIFPDTIAQYTADTGDPWCYCWISFGGSSALQYLTQAGIRQKQPVYRSSDPEETSGIIADLLGVAGGEPAQQMKRLGYLYRLLGHFAEHSAATSQCRPGAAAYFEQAVDYIRLNYANKLTVEATAKHVGVDRKYLHRIFKNASGMSCVEYIIRLRMNRACELMDNRELGIGNIACSVGYPDALLFSKTFKKHFGVSPTRYRAQRGARLPSAGEAVMSGWEYR